MYGGTRIFLSDCPICPICPICLVFRRNLISASQVFETFLKFGKLQCKSNFNRIEVLLLMIDNFEPNQIVL